MDSGPLTQEQALALLRRTSDEGWLTAELSAPDGTAVINARTAIAAATSQSFQAQADACTISDAPDARPGVCTLTVLRQTSGTRYIDIPKGYPFRTAEGIDLVVTEPITIIPGGDPQSFDLPLETLRRTELVNTYVPAFDELTTVGALMPTGTAAVDVLDYTMIGDVKDYSGSIVVLGPNAADSDYSLRYQSSTCIVNASSDWLGAHGNERGQRRQAGEETGEYRARIRMFPDAVSPVAISKGIHAAAVNAGLPDVFFVETFAPGASAAAIAAHSLSVADSSFFDLTDDFMDDPIGRDRPAKYPWRSLEILSRREARAYFRLAMFGQLKESDGAVLYLDEGYFDDTDWGFPDEGLAVRQAGTLTTIALTADQLRAGGVQYDLFVEDAIVIPDAGVAVGEGTGVPEVVWTLISDPFAVPGSETRAWMLREGLMSHTPWGNASFIHWAKFTFADATTFTTALWSGRDCDHLTRQRLTAQGFPWKPIVKIEGYIQSDTINTVNLTGTFWVVPYAL